MIKKTITAFLLAAALYAPQMAATNPPPFTATTIVAGDKFAENTIWYTLQIGNNGLFLSDNGKEDHIALGRGMSQYGDEDLWCFVGNDTDGYRIYNKAAGANKVLAASTANGANTGGNSFVILKDAKNLQGYFDVWTIEKSDQIKGVSSFFIQLKDKKEWKINNRDGKLAFWTTGADHGSSVQITPLSGTIEVSPTTGTLTANGNSATYRALWTSNSGLPLTLNAGANNMNVVGGVLQLHSGLARRGGYTFAMPVGFAVKRVDLDFQLANAGTDISIVAAGKTLKATTTTQHLTIEGDGEQNALAFEVVGDNKPLRVTNIKVVVERVKVKLEPQTNLFPYTLSTPVTYRIPAITVTGQSGTIVAVSDSRHTGTGDVGAGRVDLFAIRSHDNGVTWDKAGVFSDANGKPVAQGTGIKVDNDVNKSRDAGYGDAAIVGDRESDDVLVLSVSGFTNFFAARRNTPNAVARWYSKDAGKTFTAREDITDHIYKQFDGTTPRGHIESMFFGSGRIVQSHRTKVGTHYRLYAVMSGLNVNPQNIANWVMYSDDFGKNWHILGNPMEPAIPYAADEPKCEELPDGSLVVSTRRGHGRWFNVFRFTDTAKGQGYWDTMAHGTLVKASANPCNGELLIVPVVKKATGKKMYLALQSVPFGPAGRTNVGINYKELAGYDDFGSSANFAKEWDGAHMSSHVGSAYSVMAWQKNNTLAFMYEEETLAPATKGGYTQVYKNYSIEQITDSAYSYAADADFAVANALRTDVLKARLAELKQNHGKNLGQYSDEGWAALEKAANDYLAAPSENTYNAFNSTVLSAQRNEVDTKMTYVLRNDGYKAKGQSAYYLKFANGNVAVSSTYDAANDDFHFTLHKVEGKEDQYYLYNEKAKRFLLPLQNTNQAILTTEDKAKAGVYEINFLPSGEVLFYGVNPVNASYRYLHLSGQQTLVCWNPTEPSRWVVTPSGKPTALSTASVAQPTEAQTQSFDLSGRRVGKNHKGVAISANGKKRMQ